MQSRKQIETTRVFDTSDSMNSSTDSEDAAKRIGRDPEEGNKPLGTVAITKDAYGSPWLLQYTVLFRRALKVRRFEALSLQDFAQCICVAVLSGRPTLARLPLMRLPFGFQQASFVSALTSVQGTKFWSHLLCITCAFLDQFLLVQRSFVNSLQLVLEQVMSQARSCSGRCILSKRLTLKLKQGLLCFVQGYFGYRLDRLTQSMAPRTPMVFCFSS